MFILTPRNSDISLFVVMSYKAAISAIILLISRSSGPVMVVSSVYISNIVSPRHNKQVSCLLCFNCSLLIRPSVTWSYHTFPACFWPYMLLMTLNTHSLVDSLSPVLNPLVISRNNSFSTGACGNAYTKSACRLVHPFKNDNNSINRIDDQDATGAYFSM
jgi:hypothetical protein